MTSIAVALALAAKGASSKGPMSADWNSEQPPITSPHKQHSMPAGWDGERLLTIRDLMVLAGLKSRTGAESLVRRAGFTPVYLGRNVRFRESEVKRFLSGEA